MGRKTEKKVANRAAGTFAKATHHSEVRINPDGLCNAVAYARKELASIGVAKATICEEVVSVELSELDYYNSEHLVAYEIWKAVVAAAASGSRCVVVPLGCTKRGETQGHACCLFVDTVNHKMLHYDPHGYNSPLIEAMRPFVCEVCDILWWEFDIDVLPVSQMKCTEGIQKHHPLCMWYTMFAAFTVFSWFHESTASFDDLVLFVDRFDEMSQDASMQLSFAKWCLDYAIGA